MTQDTPIISTGKSGTTYRQLDNLGKKALLNHHKAASAPSYAEAGALWLDDAATPWLLKIHDGTDWITIAAVNAQNNTVTPYLGSETLKLLSYIADGGTVNAYSLTPVPAIASYTAGQVVTLRPAITNTGASTIVVSGLAVTDIKMPDGSDIPAGLLKTTGVYILVHNGTHFVVANAAPGLRPLLHVRDEKTSGTNGGTFTAGAWQTRVLNTVLDNSMSGASLSANQVTLPAGTYAIEATAPCYAANNHKTRLHSITDTADILIGSSETLTGNAVSTTSFIKGQFTLTGTTVLELQHRCSSTQSASGFGLAVSFGVAEVYADMMIWKLA